MRRLCGGGAFFIGGGKVFCYNSLELKGGNFFMLKKIFACAVTLAMMLGLTGCGTGRLQNFTSSGHYKKSQSVHGLNLQNLYLMLLPKLPARHR